jgi:hypothetical protein
MMSIERDLLKRCLDFMLDVGANLNPLFKEVNDELLAQPEQAEEEPVAWMNESGSCFLSDGNKYSEHWIPLYTVPKREPLGLEIMDVCGSEDYREGFKDGALYAEKAHGITGGEE